MQNYFNTAPTPSFHSPAPSTPVSSDPYGVQAGLTGFMNNPNPLGMTGPKFEI